MGNDRSVKGIAAKPRQGGRKTILQTAYELGPIVVLVDSKTVTGRCEKARGAVIATFPEPIAHVALQRDQTHAAHRSARTE